MITKIPAQYYQQWDADYTREIPAEGFKGWKKAEFEIDLEHTALVVMHAWDCGSYQAYPGWYRHVEYIPRAKKILTEVFPLILSAVRSSPMHVFHVVSGGDYYKDYPGYQIAKKAAEKEKKYPQIDKSQVRKSLDAFLSENRSGKQNATDIQNGCKKINFPPSAQPLDNEGIAENSGQLYGLCKKFGIDHLIYIGFAINWCLLLSPGGMAEMAKYGLLCSTIRECVTAVENKSTARQELCKDIALWRVSLAFGLVFDLPDLLNSLKK